MKPDVGVIFLIFLIPLFDMVVCAAQAAISKFFKISLDNCNFL